MDAKELLSNVFAGSETDRLAEGTAQTKAALKFFKLKPADWAKVDRTVQSFFGRRIKGKFGGPITAGDAYFIAAFMAAERPASMLEVGVCSGVSSAFILCAAHKLGLLKEGETFLHSVDLLSLHGPDQLEVGRAVRMNYPSLLPYWRLRTGVTAPEVAMSGGVGAPALAFVDANHMHPWPMADVVAMTKLLPKGAWVLLQDIQLMERWLMNCVSRGIPSPRPCRGVSVAHAHWPGRKISGWGMCFNMGAICLDVENTDDFVRACMVHPSECGAQQEKEVVEHLKRMGGATVVRPALQSA